MDAELKAKWVEALRSGEYVQGTKVLHDPSAGSYCCLGVLCVISGVHRDAIAFQMTTDISPWVNSGLNDDQRTTLGDWMNDADGKSFAEIADYIEKKL